MLAKEDSIKICPISTYNIPPHSKIIFYPSNRHKAQKRLKLAQTFGTRFVSFPSNPTLTESLEPLCLYLAANASLKLLSIELRKHLQRSLVCLKSHSSFSLNINEFTNSRRECRWLAPIFESGKSEILEKCICSEKCTPQRITMGSAIFSMCRILRIKLNTPKTLFLYTTLQRFVIQSLK